VKPKTQQRPKPPAKEPSRARPDPRSEGTRQRMVAGAARLLARRGLQATSFSEVLEETGTPRGSLYHHFPEGKNELVKAALDLVAGRMEAALARKKGAPATEIVELFLEGWRSVLELSDFRSGCAVLAVTVAADSPELFDSAAAIFRSWRTNLAALLVEGGLAQRHAKPFATLLLAASEGAVVLSRGERSLEPFELVAAELRERMRTLGKSR
jgi:AcrR family transcriptional regulator